jgi:hypothetical protein
VPALLGADRAGMFISLCVGFGGLQLYGQQALSVLCCAMCACARHTPVCIGRLIVRMRIIVGGRGCLNSSGGRMLHGCACVLSLVVVASSGLPSVSGQAA